MKKLISAIFLLLVSCATKPELKQIVAESYAGTVLLSSDTGSCTGFSIGEDLIVTAAHCVRSLPVVEFGSRTYPAELLLVDPEKDIAVLSTPPINDLKPFWIEFEQPDDGERLISVGFPYYSMGVRTFDVGYMRYKVKLSDNRYVYIASDVCYPGQSGSPILNEKGAVIGICSAVATMIYPLGTGHIHHNLNIIVPIGELLALSGK